MKLINNWHKSWQLISVRRAGYGLIISATGAGLKTSIAATALLPFLPVWQVSVVAALLFASVIVGRLTQQPELPYVPPAPLPHEPEE